MAITPSFHDAPHLAIVLIGLLACSAIGSLLVQGVVAPAVAAMSRALGWGL